MGKLRPTKPGSGAFRPKPPTSAKIIAPRPIVIKRPTAVNPIRGASINRVIAREIKRDGFVKNIPAQQTPPRYNLRPVAPPRKVMPKTPAPKFQVKRPLPVRPSTPPGTIPKIARKPAPIPTQAGQQVGKFTRKAEFTSGVTQPIQAGRSSTPAAIVGAAAISALMLNVAAANPQITNEVNTLNSSLEDLKSRSSLEHITDEINRLDGDLKHTINLLESARNEGYVYQKDIDETAYRLMDQWQGVKGQALGSIPQQAAAFQRRMQPLGSQLSRLNSVLGNPTSAGPLLSSTSSQVNSLLSDLNQVESSLENIYSESSTQVSELLSRLNIVHWCVDQLNQSKIIPENNEKLVIAVQARWDQEGDDDPEGILYLTNKRLIFERKEKVATKKILFITTAKELIQEVLIDQRVDTIEDEKAIHKGIFGNQDFLEVKFTNPKLGVIPFHLNGQDCVQWVNWLRKVRSGEIENERTSGTGISFSDLTGPITAADILAIQNEVNSLQDLVSLKPVREELGKIENQIRSLERNLVNVRSRGYVIEKSLESDVAILAVQWERIKTNADLVLTSQTRLLDEQLVSIKANMASLAGKSGDLNVARPQFMHIKSAIASTEAQADAADDAVIATYDQYADEVEAIAAHLEWVEWMLDALSGASFQLLATESGIAATEATWDRPGLDPENGILFLTDQRLLWEDRVDTFELKLDQPLSSISSVKKETIPEKEQDALLFELNKTGIYPNAQFTLELPVADAWVKMFGRARSGEYLTDRAVQIDQAELERIRNAPRQCSNCGAGLTAPILRGQTDITCEYCGQVTRI